MSDPLLNLDVERVRATARDIRRDLGADAIEILARTSRARVVTFEYDRAGQLFIESQGSQEAGHTVRLAAKDRWGAWSTTGAPRVPGYAPAVSSGQLGLPTLERIEALRADSAGREPTSRSRLVERPLLGESDARRWIDRLIDATIDGLRDRDGSSPAFHLRGRLEDGGAESLLVNTHGVVAPGRSRVTGVRLEMALGPRATSAYLAANEDLPSATAAALEGLITELLLRQQAVPLASAERTMVLLRPAVLGLLLAHLARRCWTPGATAQIRGLDDAVGATLWDRPDLAPGFLGGDRDGEGLHARSTLLLDPDGFHRVRPWDRLAEGDSRTGFRWRASWRDLPRFGPSHLLLQTDQATEDPAADLGHGIEIVCSRGGLALHGDELALDAFGYRIEGGRRTEPLCAQLLIPEQELLARWTCSGGPRESHTLPACTVSTPSALFDALALEPPSTRVH